MRRLVLQVCLAIPLVTACSSEKDRPPVVGGGCVTNCGTIGGSNEHDSSTTGDALSDVSFDIGEAGVSVAAKTTFLNRYPADPTKGTARTNVTVRAQRVGGGTSDVLVVNADGSFTLDGISPSIGIPTWFTLVEGGVVTGYAGLRYPWDSSAGIVFPIFDDTLPATTTGTVTSGSATIVVHVVDATGKRVAGVSATAVGTAVPFYDSGSDSVESTATATGGNGTVVFLGVPPGLATVSLTFMGKAQPSLTVPTGADATSWTQVTIE
jgi:hypothetical protein